VAGGDSTFFFLLAVLAQKVLTWSNEDAIALTGDLRYSFSMRGDIDRILIPRERIAARVRELAGHITADFMAADGSPEITIVPILTGAMIFCADLIREIPITLRIGLITVSSYPGRTVSSQGAQVIARQLEDVRGRNVLLLDDILDTGNTLRLVAPLLKEMGAAAVRTCVLLRKDRPSARSFAADYVGFEIPDEFVVGYGLDFNNNYRNLPEIVTLKPHVLEAAL
jgi:hypoxanthine phosphoribosyltransferase